MKKKLKKVYPIKCYHCGQRIYVNKDFTIANDWKEFQYAESKRIDDASRITGESK